MGTIPRSPEIEARRLAALRLAMQRPRSQQWKAAQKAGIQRAIAEGRITFKRTPESRKKGAEKLRGRKRPAEVVAKIKQANLGKKRSAEFRLAMSRRLKQEFKDGKRRPPSLEQRKLIGAKISAATKGRSISLEQRLHQSAVMKGRKAAPEAVEARARALRGRAQTALVTKKGSTNQGSLEGVLRSPENKLYPFRNLTQFVRDHPELFLPEDVQWNAGGYSCRASKALINLFGRGKVVNGSWKGWTKYSWTEHEINCGGDLLDRPWLL